MAVRHVPAHVRALAPDSFWALLDSYASGALSPAACRIGQDAYERAARYCALSPAECRLVDELFDRVSSDASDVREDVRRVREIFAMRLRGIDASIKSLDYGEPLLSLALGHSLAMTRTLLEMGGDVNAATDMDGETVGAHVSEWPESDAKRQMLELLSEFARKRKTPLQLAPVWAQEQAASALIDAEPASPVEPPRRRQAFDPPCASRSCAASAAATAGVSPALRGHTAGDGDDGLVDERPDESVSESGDAEMGMCDAPDDYAAAAAAGVPTASQGWQPWLGGADGWHAWLPWLGSRGTEGVGDSRSGAMLLPDGAYDRSSGGAADGADVRLGAAGAGYSAAGAGYSAAGACAYYWPRDGCSGVGTASAAGKPAKPAPLPLPPPLSMLGFAAQQQQQLELAYYWPRDGCRGAAIAGSGLPMAAADFTPWPPTPPSPAPAASVDRRGGSVRGVLVLPEQPPPMLPLSRSAPVGAYSHAARQAASTDHRGATASLSMRGAHSGQRGWPSHDAHAADWAGSDWAGLHVQPGPVVPDDFSGC